MKKDIIMHGRVDSGSGMQSEKETFDASGFFRGY
jgi:hypothetical protein